MNRTTGYLDGIRVGTMHSSIDFRFGCKVNDSTLGRLSITREDSVSEGKCSFVRKSVQIVIIMKNTNLPLESAA